MTLKKFGHDQTFLIVQFNDQIVLVTQIWQLKIGYKSFVIIKTNLIKKIPYQKTWSMFDLMNKIDVQFIMTWTYVDMMTNSKSTHHIGFKP